MSRSSSQNIVLLVDNTSNYLTAATSVLRQKEFDVLFEIDARKGYEAALKENPDLIISGILPPASGLELCRLVRADERLKTLPILLTGALQKDSTSVIEAFQAGADDFLEAPFAPEFLLAKVSNLIKRKRELDDIKKLGAEFELQITELEAANQALRLELNELKLFEEQSRLQQKILLEVNEAEDFHSSIGIFLRNICEATGWVYAEAWVPRSDESHLEPSPSWYSVLKVWKNSGRSAKL
jgi:DNA-binding response OmpR family regulator